MKKILVLAAAMALAGCTTAGPFVTSVSTDGLGGLLIEKCKVEFNAWLGVVNMGQCISTGSR